MAIKSIITQSIGQSGVTPRIIYIETDDPVNVVTATGYLNNVVNKSKITVSDTDLAVVAIKPTSGTNRYVGLYEVEYSGGNWSLVNTANTFDMNLLDGQMLIGKTGDLAQPAYLTAGTNVTISNGPGAVTINAGVSGSSNFFSFTTTIDYTQLAGAAPPVVLMPANGRSFRLRDLYLDGTGTGTNFSGGDRALQVTNGVQILATVPAATMQALVNARWGTSDLTGPTGSNYYSINSLTTNSIVAEYASTGTTDYTAGELVISGVVELIP